MTITDTRTGLGLTHVLIDLAEAVMALGEVQRKCLHPDGSTQETDTTHSVMVALASATLAERLYPHLDQAAVLWASLAHDMVEIVVGDVMTWGIDPDQMAAKHAREAEAARVLVDRFSRTAPRLARTISDYEMQATPEARFVKAVDKLLPKVTHLLNEAAALRLLSTKPEADALWERQRTEMGATYAAEFPLLLDLHADLADLVRPLLND